VSSLERMLGLLDAFSGAAPVWTVDALGETHGLSRSTAYRYVKDLCKAGLLAPVGGGGYSLGPRIIELDRQIRNADPLLTAARDTLSDLLPRVGEGILFICGLRGDAVLSVFLMENPNTLDISYSRGRPMPLFRGSASVIIRVIRAQPYLTGRAQLDPGVFAISTPVFDADGNILASLTLAMPESRADSEEVVSLAALVGEGAARITAAVASRAPLLPVVAGHSQA
jgi:DNA-binding IclR family transcriptional regulator